MTELYRVFYIVVLEGSMSKAAKRLFVSQPAISKSIAQLEETLEVQLLIRTGKGIALTREGEALYEHVSVAMRQIEMGEKRVQQLKERAYGAIRIGISNTLCKYYFMPHLEAFHQVYPNLKIEIVNRTSPETYRLLEAGFLDCAIISDMTVSKAMDYRPLMKIQDIFVAKNGPRQEPMNIHSVEKEPMLLLERNNASREYLDAYLNQQGVNLTVDIEISSMEFLIDFAKIGLGVACVIGNFVEEELQDGRLKQWKISPEIPPRTIGLLLASGGQLSVAARTFVDFMMKRRTIADRLPADW